MKKKVTAFRVILVCFLILFMIASQCLVTYWDDVSAVVDGFSYSEEQIDNIRIENQKEVDKELSKYPDLYFRNLTEEEIKALSEGKITQDDVPYLVTGRKVFANGVVMTTEEYEKLTEKENQDNEIKEDQKPNKQPPAQKEDNKQETGKEVTNNNQQPTKPEEPANEQAPPKTNPELEAVLEKFFVLKANLLADVEAQVNAMIAEYKSIPKKERTKAVRSQYANKALSLMSVMEPQYDAQFEAVVSELEAVIEKIDGDPTLVTTVRDAYKKEKAAMKAKYVSKARKHL